MTGLTILQALPCATCKSECCGPVPVRAGELRRIVRHLATTYSPQAIERLAGQKRDELTCPFVDVEKWRCSVWQERPTVCDLYGRTDGLQCPHAPAISREIKADEAFQRLAVDEAIYGQVVGILGASIGWPELKTLISEAQA